MLWLFLKHKRQITLDGSVGKWINISGGVGGVEKDDSSMCTGTVTGSGASGADSGAGFGETWSSGCTGNSGKSGSLGSSGAGVSGCGTGDGLCSDVIAGDGVTSECGIVCCEGGVFAQTGVGGDGNDDEEDRGSLQKRGERRRAVSLSSPLNSSASQHLFPALHVRFVGGESSGDGDGGGCSSCGGLGSKGVLRRCCVVVCAFSAAAWLHQW
jgi:hypothetical protein